MDSLEAAVAQHNWQLVIAAVIDAADQGAALQVAGSGLEDWSDESRVLPTEIWRAVQRGAPPPAWWPLARHLTLTSDDDLTGLGRAPFLRSLDLTEYDGPLAPLAAMPELRALRIGNSNDWPALRPLDRLESLTLWAPDALPALDELALPSSLKTLVIHGTDLRTLRGLEHLAALRRLELRENRVLSDIGALASLAGPAQLTITRCRELADLSPIGALAGLVRLELSALDAVTALPALGALVELTELVVGGAQLGSLSEVASLRSLERLRISDAPRVVDLTPLAGLGSLRVLELSALTQLTDARPLRSLASLTALTLSHLERLADLSPLAALRAVETLTLQSLPALRSLGFLADWHALAQLSVAYCRGIDDIAPLARATGLRIATLRELGVRDVSPLARLPQLEQLTVAQTPLPAGLDSFDPRRTQVHHGP